MSSSAAKFKLRNFRAIAPLQSVGSTVEAAPNKQMLLYRSSNLDNADDDTVSYLKNELGIKTIIDLRNVSPAKPALTEAYKSVTVAQYLQEKKLPETDRRNHVFLPFINTGYLIHVIRRQPYRLYPQIASLLFRYFAMSDESALQDVGKIAGKDGLLQTYIDFLSTGQHVVKGVLEILSNSDNVPALICCQLGKDRTGVICALVLHILGHSKEEIVNEYHLTQEMLKEIRVALVKDLQDKYKLDESFADAHKQTLLDLYKWYEDTHGSIDNYLTSAGVSEELRSSLRRTLRPASTNTNTNS